MVSRKQRRFPVTRPGIESDHQSVAVQMHAVGWCCHGPRPCRLRLRPNHQSDVGACGLDLTPDHPGFAQGAQRAAEVKQNGFLRACKANLERYSVTFFPLVLVRAGLAYYELWLEANTARDPLRRQLFALPRRCRRRSRAAPGRFRPSACPWAPKAFRTSPRRW